MAHTRPAVTLFCLGQNYTHIGPRRISGYLKSKGIGVRLVFVPCDNNFSIEPTVSVMRQLLDLIKSDTVIAFSFFSNYLGMAASLTELIRKELRVPIVWGGVHPTAAPEDTIKVHDTICLGEGEEALCEYVLTLARGESPWGLRNFWFQSEGRVIRNQQRPLITDLDTLPFQDFDLSDHHLFTDDSLCRMTLRHLRSNFGFSLTRMMTFGCPYRCTYCINDRYQELYDRHASLRHYSVDYFVEETIHALNALPFVHYLMIDDDAFLNLPERVIEEFCAKWKARVKLPFGIGGMRPEAVTEEKVAMLVDAGLITVRMGVQSGSVRTNRELFLRNFSPERTLAAARIFKRFSRRIRPPFIDVIVDNPWESLEDRLDTLAFVQRLPRPYFMSAFSLTLFPGTRLYERALAERRIDGFDPRKHFFAVKRDALNTLIVLSSFVRLPGGLLGRIMRSRRIGNRNREYKIAFAFFSILNLLGRLVSFYANRRFLKSMFRKRRY